MDEILRMGFAEKKQMNGINLQPTSALTQKLYPS